MFDAQLTDGSYAERYILRLPAHRVADLVDDGVPVVVLDGGTRRFWGIVSAVRRDRAPSGAALIVFIWDTGGEVDTLTDTVVTIVNPAEPR